MDASSLVRRAFSIGIQLGVTEDGVLRYQGPPGPLTDQVLADLRAHVDEVRALVIEEPPRCGRVPCFDEVEMALEEPHLSQEAAHLMVQAMNLQPPGVFHFVLELADVYAATKHWPSRSCDQAAAISYLVWLFGPKFLGITFQERVNEVFAWLSAAAITADDGIWQPSSHTVPSRSESRPEANQGGV